uniref:Fibronectin type-III domain-containing protein n=1 Tax=viral metagenome TaxID=1070528 RepID=A0A6C0AS14_9ZZZZ
MSFSTLGTISSRVLNSKTYPNRSGTIPSAPTAVTTTVVPSGSDTVTSVSVSFTPPSGTVSGYTVISNPGSIKATGTASPITVTGLTSGTSYTFTVTATNSAGTSSESTASSSVTPYFILLRSTGQVMPLIWYKFNDNKNSGYGGSIYDGSLNGTAYTVGPSTANGIPVSNAGILTATGNNTSWFSVPSWTSTSAGFTISFWVYPLSSTGSLFQFGTTANQFNYVLQFFGNQYYLYGTDTGGSIGQFNFPTPTINAWTHYAFVHTTTAQATFYKNGVSAGTVSNWSVPFGTRSLNYIGSGFQNSKTNPNSYITDFEIHTTALSASQVLSIYQATSLTN